MVLVLSNQENSSTRALKNGGCEIPSEAIVLLDFSAPSIPEPLTASAQGIFLGCSLTFAVIRSGSFIMGQVNVEQIRSAIRDIPDFPKPGILFKDITPILGDGKLFQWVIDRLAEEAHKANPSKMVGIDARGFLFGAAVAYKLGVGCVPVRKKGKLPFKTIGSSYQLEYGNAEVEMHIDAITAGERVVLIDDLLATGGTSGAAVNLVQKGGGIVGSALFFIELSFLNGREKLPPEVPVYSMVQF